MAFSDHLEAWLGRPVRDFQEGADPAKQDGDPIFRFRSEYDGKHTALDQIRRFAETPHAAEATAIVVGMADPEYFGDMESTPFSPVADYLIAERARWPKLAAIFMGDFTYEECEISWMPQFDITELLVAYPGLEHFVIRGSDTSMKPIRHICLRSLIFQSGGLSKSVLASVNQSVIPELEHLEFYLGEENYGGDCGIEDVRPFLDHNPFSKLTYLGLRDSEIADEIAAAAANAPVLDQLETLDLSLGTLGDTGAEALLAGEKVRSLKKLDLHHHFMSDAVSDRVQQELTTAGVEFDVSDQEEDDDYRYVAVGE